MSVLTYIETQEGKIKKQSLEAATYAYKTAEKLSTESIAVVLGSADDLSPLSQYGVDKIIHLNNPKYDSYNDKAASSAIAEIANETVAEVLVFSLSSYGGALAPEVAVKVGAGIVNGAVDIPDTSDGFKVKKSVFSGKAFAFIGVKSAKKVLGILPGSYISEEKATQPSSDVRDSVVADENFTVTTVSKDKVTGSVPLNEAELVVSGGRGMKGPENWPILEDLAEELGASMACSRPVADSHWRPHHEHVGQTGGTIRPKLYVAVGISGAIQHLAGVNNSKNIVVINSDPEAPFFQVADYGVVGDAMEVVPRLTEALKKYNASKN